MAFLFPRSEADLPPRPTLEELISMLALHGGQKDDRGYVAEVTNGWQCVLGNGLGWLKSEMGPPKGVEAYKKIMEEVKEFVEYARLLQGTTAELKFVDGDIHSVIFKGDRAEEFANDMHESFGYTIVLGVEGGEGDDLDVAYRNIVKYFYVEEDWPDDTVRERRSRLLTYPSITRDRGSDPKVAKVVLIGIPTDRAAMREFLTSPLPDETPSGAPAPDSPGTVTEDVQNYAALRKLYEEKYKPPQWVQDDSEDLLRKYGSQAYVLYIGGDAVSARTLATEREPVNIAMGRHYDHDGLSERFGYSTGAYESLTEGGTRLPPQIAVACVTPVRYAGKSVKNVAVVNLIGLAFDSANQPDRQLLIRDKVNKKLNGSEPVVFEAMKRAYYMAFVAAEKLERTELCCSPIGNVAFKPPEFTQEEFEEKFVWPAVKAASDEFHKSRPGKPKIDWIRAKFNPTDETHFEVPKKLLDSTSMWGRDFDKRLFVNAWDCWSMLGNGNELDGSSDGYWGRSSAISLLGWPTSNHQIQFKDAGYNDDPYKVGKTAIVLDVPFQRDDPTGNRVLGSNAAAWYGNDDFDSIQKYIEGYRTARTAAAPGAPEETEADAKAKFEEALQATTDFVNANPTLLSSTEFIEFDGIWRGTAEGKAIEAATANLLSGDEENVLKYQEGTRAAIEFRGKLKEFLAGREGELKSILSKLVQRPITVPNNMEWLEGHRTFLFAQRYYFTEGSEKPIFSTVKAGEDNPLISDEVNAYTSDEDFRAIVETITSKEVQPSDDTKLKDSLRGDGMTEEEAVNAMNNLGYYFSAVRYILRETESESLLPERLTIYGKTTLWDTKTQLKDIYLALQDQDILMYYAIERKIEMIASVANL